MNFITFSYQNFFSLSLAQFANSNLEVAVVAAVRNRRENLLGMCIRHLAPSSNKFLYSSTFFSIMLLLFAMNVHRMVNSLCSFIFTTTKTNVDVKVKMFLIFFSISLTIDESLLLLISIAFIISVCAIFSLLLVLLPSKKLINPQAYEQASKGGGLASLNDFN